MLAGGSAVQACESLKRAPLSRHRNKSLLPSSSPTPARTIIESRSVYDGRRRIVSGLFVGSGRLGSISLGVTGLPSWSIAPGVTGLWAGSISLGVTGLRAGSISLGVTWIPSRSVSVGITGLPSWSIAPWVTGLWAIRSGQPRRAAAEASGDRVPAPSIPRHLTPLGAATRDPDCASCWNGRYDFRVRSRADAQIDVSGDRGGPSTRYGFLSR
jgi:hypothetical protein